MVAIQAQDSNESAISNYDRLYQFKEQVLREGLVSYEPLLPLLLTLKGKPLTLATHFPFEPLFLTACSAETTVVAGRQVGKSVAMASRGLLWVNAIEDFSILYVTPLYEQIQRFSTQYIRPFIEGSPVKNCWVGTDTENNILRRSFKSRGRMYFSFAYLDADRIRGVSADAISIDEVQDMNIDHLPIIKETMSASLWKIMLTSGTPKTLDNTIHHLWLTSSRAEWFVPCYACGKVNIASASYDLIKMIGPDHPDIGPHRPGTICAKCARPIDPAKGRWVHYDVKSVERHAGYHIPQPIMPMHYGNRRNWNTLLHKMNGGGNTTTARFYNECLGESYDVGTKLVNETDLRAACVLPWKNAQSDTMTAVSHIGRYAFRILAVDWGGGGEKRTSYTACAVLGWNTSGKIDCLYGRRLLTPHDPIREASELLEIFRLFQCQMLVHDYGGAGSLRETFMVQAGVLLDAIVPISYVGASRQNIMVYKAPTEFHPRAYWQVDKTRSLLTTCSAIKFGLLRFFEYDYISNENLGLLHDFLALVENKIENMRGSDIYTITRAPAFPDDFAQAVNIGCCVLWQKSNSWPDLASAAKMRYPTPMGITYDAPPSWEDLGGY